MRELHAIESRLFDASHRTENSLINLHPSNRGKALDLLLHIPTEDPITTLDLLEISQLLDNHVQTANDHRLAHDLLEVYGEAAAQSWQKSNRSQLDKRVDALLAKHELKQHREFGTRLSAEAVSSLPRCKSTVSNGHSEFVTAMEGLSLSNEQDDDNFDLAGFKEQISEKYNNNETPEVSQMDDSLRPPVPKKARVDNMPKPQVISSRIDSAKTSLKKKEVIEITDDLNSDDDVEMEDSSSVHNRAKDFMTAKQLKSQQDFKKNGRLPDRQTRSSAQESNNSSSNAKGKTLGVSRRKFVPPMKNNSSDGMDNLTREVSKRVFKNNNNSTSSDSGGNSEEPVDERLKNIDPKMVETIQNEIMDIGTKIDWDDIAGLHHAKQSIKEAVIWPMQRPDIFTGLRSAPKGILLFGPPGTGKTMIGKCIASTAGCTFFSISASSLTSKWIGEGEKMVRALFAVARVHQPSVIFIDEIDSLLTQRSDGEVEASRRIKTEFLIQFDGAHVSKEDDHILVIGATNRPQEIDEAARRRLIKRYYIPLPDVEARISIMTILLKRQNNDLTVDQIKTIAEKTRGYSGSDMDGLCREASLGPIREIPPEQIVNISLDQVRPVSYEDFDYALSQVRASVSDKDLELYRQWNSDFGSLPDALVVKE